MHALIPVVAGFLGVAGALRLRKQRCSSCRRKVRVAGMVGACCKSCAHGHKCESEMSESELSEYYGTAGARPESRYKSRKRRF